MQKYCFIYVIVLISFLLHFDGWSNPCYFAISLFHSEPRPRILQLVSNSMKEAPRWPWLETWNLRMAHHGLIHHFFQLKYCFTWRSFIELIQLFFFLQNLAGFILHSLDFGLFVRICVEFVQFGIYRPQSLNWLENWNFKICANPFHFLQSNSMSLFKMVVLNLRFAIALPPRNSLYFRWLAQWL